MPAYPKPLLISDDSGGQVSIVLKGDENIKYAVTTSTGHGIAQDTLGNWRYLSKDSKGKVILSEYKVSLSSSPSLNDFLMKTPAGLKPTISTKGIMKVAARGKVSEKVTPVVGQRKALIILAQFPDCKFSRTTDDFEMLFNMPGYKANDATGSVYDFFDEVSEGQLTLNSVIIGPFTTSKKMSHYGRNTGFWGGDENPYDLFLEALEFAKIEVDLKEFDCDGNGYVDNIHIIYAGYGEEAGADASTIWAYESSFEDIEITNGLKINTYSCSPELRDNSGTQITTIGPPCHEICHALGAMDFYDTDYSKSNGEYCGTGSWDVMGQGSWNNDGSTPAWPNPYVRAYNFGWTTPVRLGEDDIYEFSPDTHLVYQANTGIDGDYYLLDYHDGSGFMSAEPGEGVMIFHIGPDIQSRELTNTVNASYPQQCYPVCASSLMRNPQNSPGSYGDVNSAGCPYPGSSGNTAFDTNSIPAAMAVNGRNANFGINDISDQGIPSFRFTIGESSLDDNENQYIVRDSFEPTTWQNWTQNTNFSNYRWENIIEPSSEHEHYVRIMKDASVLLPRDSRINIQSTAFEFVDVYNNVPDFSGCSFEIEIRNTTGINQNITLKVNNGIIQCGYANIVAEATDEWITYRPEIFRIVNPGQKISVEIEAFVQSYANGNIDIDNFGIIASRNSSIATPEMDIKDKPRTIYNLQGLPVDNGGSLPKGIYLIPKDDGGFEKYLLR